jgi:hypothetical protein
MADKPKCSAQIQDILEDLAQVEEMLDGIQWRVSQLTQQANAEEAKIFESASGWLCTALDGTVNAMVAFGGED